MQCADKKGCFDFVVRPVRRPTASLSMTTLRTDYFSMFTMASRFFAGRLRSAARASAT
jgi:hypothetical protein